MTQSAPEQNLIALAVAEANKTYPVLNWVDILHAVVQATGREKS